MRFIRVTREGHRALYDNTQCDFVGQLFRFDETTFTSLRRKDSRCTGWMDSWVLRRALTAKRNTFGDGCFMNLSTLPAERMHGCLAVGLTRP